MDRVRLNTGKKQVYGTQVTYNMNTGQAYPKRSRGHASRHQERCNASAFQIADGTATRSTRGCRSQNGTKEASVVVISLGTAILHIERSLST